MTDFYLVTYSIWWLLQSFSYNWLKSHIKWILGWIEVPYFYFIFLDYQFHSDVCQNMEEKLLLPGCVNLTRARHSAVCTAVPPGSLYPVSAATPALPFDPAQLLHPNWVSGFMILIIKLVFFLYIWFSGLKIPQNYLESCMVSPAHEAPPGLGQEQRAMPFRRLDVHLRGKKSKR